MKKMVFLVLLACSNNSFGQWTEGDTIPDFTLNDLEGDQHNLYSLLDDGKVVFLDFFFPACSPCWDGAVRHGLKDATAFYGESGSNQMRTFAINTWGGGEGTWSGDLAVPNINGVDISNQNISRGDFEFNANFPILPQGTAYSDSDMVNIQFAPTYIMVCPNRRAYASYYSDIPADALSYCNVTLAKTADRVRIHLPEISTCSGFNHVNIYGHLRNTGSTNITSARVKLMVNNTVISSQDLTYSGTNNTSLTMGLTEFKFDNVLIDQALGEYGKGPYKIVVDRINGIDLITPIEKIIKIKKTVASTTSTDLNVELKTDGYSAETSWVIYNSLGEIVTQNPSLQNNVTTNTPITLSNNECYTVRLKDTYGDGINNDGYLKLETPSNTELCNLHYTGFNYENFGYDVFHSVKVGSLSVSYDELNDLLKLSIYPNPTSDKFTVESSQKVMLEIVDLNGKMIRSIADVDNTMSVDISDLESGVYIVNVTNGTASQAIRIVKD